MGLLVARNLLILLFMTIFFKISVHASDCTSERHDYLESIQSCLAIITCSETSRNFQNQYQMYSNGNNSYNHPADSAYYCGTIFVVLQFGSSSENLLKLKSYDETNNFIKYLKITNDESTLLPTAAIKHFINLREITATQNSFKVLNLSDLISLTNLLEIDFSNNKINVIQSEDQYDSLLSNVVSLNLSYNLLESLPGECFTYFNKLQMLDVSHNLLTSFEILTFEGIKQLVTLNLSHNRLFEIGHSFARFKNLRDLNLNDNQLTLIQDINFKSMVKLETLNISSNQIEVIDSSSFNHLSSLLELDLSCNKIDILSQNIFRNNSKLHSLFISGNNLATIEPKAFVGSNITYFDFSKNCPTETIESKTFQRINVTDLDLSNSKINGIGSRAYEPPQNNLRGLSLTKNIISYTDTNTTSEGKMTDNNIMLEELKMMFREWENENTKRANLAEMYNSNIYIYYNSIISDVTVLLYVIAICLATILVVLVFSKVYNHCKKRPGNFNSVNGSRENISECTTVDME